MRRRMDGMKLMRMRIDDSCGRKTKSERQILEFKRCVKKFN